KTSELQSFVKKKLPDYMIPSAFVFLERFPLNINGKVDRQALPPPLTNSDELEREYVAPRTELERFLADNWQHRLGVKQVGVHDNFFEMGGDSIRAALFINDLQQKGGEFVHIVTLFDNPTIADLAIFLSEQFPNAVARMCGLRPAGEKAKAGVRHAARVDEEAVAHIRELIPILPPFRESQKELKNPQAIFILCPPRSGSTLLRVMLAGHSELFAPPELQLLCFNTLTDRKEAFAGRFNFWLEGTIRALMEIKGCDDEKARALMEAYEQEGMSAKEFYRLMQEWIGRRRLVDKTPGYALDIEVLRRAERYFENPLYIHLIRSPYGMINSFEKAKLDQIFKYGHEYSVRELGELMWLVCHQNILEFLREVPEQRQFKIRFETLVAQPRDVMEKLCRFAGLEFYPDMLQPQQNGKRKMTDGIHGLSRMLGDINFHEHKSIDSQVANRWKESVTEDFLGEVTLKVAQSLGYERIGESATKDDGYELSAKEAMTIRQIRRDGKTQLPVSLGQQRVWSLTRMAPNNPFYNVTFSKRLIGRLNVQAFEQSIQELVRRHESLRTGFPIINGEPMQVITPSVTVKPMIADLSKLPKDEREACARNLLSQDEQLRFDLNQASLLRVYLLRLDKEEHILLLTMHHLVCDPWSIGLLIKELIALYKVFLAGQLSTLPVPLIQYADYAMWQREWLRGEELEKQASYWKKQLAGAPALLNLPTDRARQAIPTYEGARMMIETPGEVYDRLNELSRQEGATLFMTVLAAFQLLLCRYTGQEDVYIGSHITNRYRPEIEATVGFFANTLIFRTDLSGKPTFRELLRRARKVTLEAYAHQDLPFEQLIEILQPERGFGYVPSVQVVFNMMNVGFDPQRVPGLRVDELTVHRVTAKFDLCLVLFPDLSGFLDYSAELFDNSTIERMIRDFQTILASVAANPDAKI
ncbi:MAG TPA: condensation domain-containing protein, partial [Blastocatellia bacterium]|nr:condensation domain-containing protein [Blastocatellia bacterium]